VSGSVGLPSERCAAFAAAIDLDVEAIGICHACLSFVSIPLDRGDLATARREARRIAPDLWDEGLAEPLLAAVERARDDGVPDADAACRDVRTRGPRSATVRAIVLRLAGDLAERVRADLELTSAARSRLRLAPPELN
jgi:hypothetical protein